jgi:aryl-alcohol dehydrogenase-like predicted oxidoreductase/predicted kinase
MWLEPGELRVGLGCMRLSTDAERDEERAAATVAAAAGAGVTVFDTAHAYGHGPHELGHNERLLATALRRCGAAAGARVVTKGGMTRPGGRWVPDGRAKAIRAGCEASLAALGGLPIDLYLLHEPDPRTPWQTSVRALARLADERLVRRVGLSNVSLPQLEAAVALAPVAAVEVGLSVLDDRALRGGLVARCAELGIALIAHSPLGGPRRVRSLGRREPLAQVAAAHGAMPAQVALAWLLGLPGEVVAIPGARRPESAQAAAAAAALRPAAHERAALSRAFGPARPRRPLGRRPASEGDVVVVMGIPGAGKTRFARGYAERGYARLNRDERGGSLRALADALEHELAAGARRVVLDNTYLTRAARSHVLDAAGRLGLGARCVWLDTPLAQAQVNLVERLLERHGQLPGPDELRALARRSSGVLAPTSQMRAARELEPPSREEGWAAVERVPFVRAAPAGRLRAGIFVAAAALAPGLAGALAQAEPAVAHLLFDWRPDAAPDALAPERERLAALAAGPVEATLCTHGGGPPRCWCRPPLPGLPLAFARRHGIDPARSTLIGTSAAHRALAAALGCRYVAADN